MRTVLAIALLGYGAHSPNAYAQDVLVKIPQKVAKRIGSQAGTGNLLELLGLTQQASIEEGVTITMRDGVLLAATVIYPAKGSNDRGRLPAILIKTPYSPAFELPPGMRRDVIATLVRSGYVLVLVNERGTRWSGGVYRWMRGAGNDGYDTLNWIAAQAWSNGRVGTFGCSSSGEGQIALATMNHPAHKAMVPMSAGTAVGEIPGYSDQGVWYIGGVPQLFWAWWFQMFGHQAHPQMPAGLSQDERVRLANMYSPDISMPLKPNVERHLPSADALKSAGVPPTDFDELIRVTPADDVWNEYDLLRDGDSTHVPALHMSSWYDMVEIYPTLRMYEYLSRNSPNQYLVVGPTEHCLQGTESQRTVVGEHHVGDARFDYPRLIVSFFDFFVKGDQREPFRAPPVQFYVMGASKWHAADRWPVEARQQRLYLHSQGHSNSLWGDGVLRSDPPQAHANASTLVADPSNPVPSRGASCCPESQSVDQREVEARSDVLVFTTPPLEQELSIAGYVRARLFLSSDVPDADLMLKLVVVHPDGRALNLFDTAQRLRYRNGIRKVELMSPQQVYEVEINQMVTAIRLPAGHRVRIEIAGSNFPAYERNLHTGGRNFDESVPRVAKSSIFHDAQHASYIELPAMQDTKQPNAKHKRK